MRKLILVLSLITFTTSFASVPIKDKNGCLVGTRGIEFDGYKENTKVTIPFYLMLGKIHLETFQEKDNCPKISKAIIDIKILFTNMVVGHLNMVFSDAYISVDKTSNIKYFPTRDVYDEQRQEWSFKDLRNN